jgi:hypothetical protein
MLEEYQRDGGEDLLEEEEDRAPDLEQNEQEFEISNMGMIKPVIYNQFQEALILKMIILIA